MFSAHVPDGQEEEIWEIQTFPHVKIKKRKGKEKLGDETR